MALVKSYLTQMTDGGGGKPKLKLPQVTETPAVVKPSQTKPSVASVNTPVNLTDTGTKANPPPYTPPKSQTASAPVYDPGGVLALGMGPISDGEVGRLLNSGQARLTFGGSGGLGLSPTPDFTRPVAIAKTTQSEYDRLNATPKSLRQSATVSFGSGAQGTGGTTLLNMGKAVISGLGSNIADLAGTLQAFDNKYSDTTQRTARAVDEGRYYPSDGQRQEMAQKLFDASDYLSRTEQQAGEAARAGKGPVGQAVVNTGLLLGNGMAQAGANALVPGLGTALRVMDLAGGATRDYRLTSGEAYDPGKALLRGAVSGSGVALGSVLEKLTGGVSIDADHPYSSALWYLVDVPELWNAAGAGLYAVGETFGDELGRALTEEGYALDWRRVGRSGLGAAAFAYLNGLAQSAVIPKRYKAEVRDDLKDVEELHDQFLQALADPNATREEISDLARRTVDMKNWTLRRLDEFGLTDSSEEIRGMQRALDAIGDELQPYADMGSDPWKIGYEADFGGAEKWVSGFLPTSDYTRPNGTVDWNAAREDYKKIVLPTIPEKNRILLEQSMDAVEYRCQSMKTSPISYFEGIDTIAYDPSHPAFADIDFDVAFTHELAHRIDGFFVHSWEETSFSDSIDRAKLAPDRVWKQAVEYCRANDEDGFLSDIFDALCESECIFPYGHSKKYWMVSGNKASEIFANLFSLEALGDTEKLNYFAQVFPDVINAYHTFDFWIR